MFTFCTQFVQRERLNAACFIEWVFLMNEFVFADNDGYDAAHWALQTIKDLFYPNIDWETEELGLPSSII